MLCWSGWICSSYVERTRTKELLSAEHNTRCLLLGIPELIFKILRSSKCLSQDLSQKSCLRLSLDQLFALIHGFTWRVNVAAWPRHANVLFFHLCAARADRDKRVTDKKNNRQREWWRLLARVINCSWTHEIVSAVLIVSLLSLLMVRPHECTSTCPLDEALGVRGRLRRTAAWHWHSPPSTQEEKLSRGRANRNKLRERCARWGNKKMRWKRAQLRPVVNNAKEASAREEHVVALETEQRLNRTTYYWQEWSSRGGRGERERERDGERESEREPADHSKHASAFLLLNALRAWSTAVPHFASSMTVQLAVALRGQIPSANRKKKQKKNRVPVLQIWTGAAWIRKASSLWNWGDAGLQESEPWMGPCLSFWLMCLFEPCGPLF